jgi:transcriptional regulator with XRE-family HTH domain
VPHLVFGHIAPFQMSAQKLPNYLRTYPKHAGLSQAEIALLLGTQSGTKVSRYERWNRQASLRTAFAYEVIFGVPARELFAGMYAEVERATEGRIAELTRRLGATPADRATARKLAVLQRSRAAPPESACRVC